MPRPGSAERVVRVTRHIAAPAEKIFALLDDPSQHPNFDGSGSVKASRTTSRHLVLGDRFSMDMKIGLPYRMSSKVVEYEKDRLIAWAHFGGHRWRYKLMPTENGTEVTEEFDWATSKFPPYIELVGYPKRHPTAMAATLERLAALLA